MHCNGLAYIYAPGRGFGDFQTSRRYHILSNISWTFKISETCNIYIVTNLPNQKQLELEPFRSEPTTSALLVPLVTWVTLGHCQESAYGLGTFAPSNAGVVVNLLEVDLFYDAVSIICVAKSNIIHNVALERTLLHLNIKCGFSDFQASRSYHIFSNTSWHFKIFKICQIYIVTKPS